MNTSMHGRPLSGTAATSGKLKVAHSVSGIVSVHATPLQHCTQFFCCTGTLVMPIRRESVQVHLSLVHIAIERFGGGMSVLMGGCITGVP